MAPLAPSSQKPQPDLSIPRFFARLKDPRRVHRRLHQLQDILVVALCAVIAGAQDWQQIVTFGRNRLDWLRGFLELANGIPSHDTFERVFDRLKPQAFQACFQEWVQAISAALRIKHIAIDGKTLRGSGSAKLGPLHLVSAWASAQHLSLGQVAVAAKSNDSSSRYPFQKRNCWTLPSRSCLNWASVIGVSGNKYSFQVRCFLTWIVPL
jgi:hypothetical protein